MANENPVKEGKVRTLAQAFSRELSAEEIAAVSGSYKIGTTSYPIDADRPTDVEGDSQGG